GSVLPRAGCVDANGALACAIMYRVCTVRPAAFTVMSNCGYFVVGTLTGRCGWSSSPDTAIHPSARRSGVRSAPAPLVMLLTARMLATAYARSIALTAPARSASSILGDRAGQPGAQIDRSGAHRSCLHVPGSLRS